MRVPELRVSEVLSALRAAHPYEEPAFDLYPLRSTVDRPCSRIGSLARPQTVAEFVRVADMALATRCWAFGNALAKVQTVAVCGGAADDEWRAAIAEGADLFLTGELKHHNAVEASESGLVIVAAGHYATEHPGCEALRKALKSRVPNVAWHLYEPTDGQAGRPILPN
jgi:putative NIF3 family GTP cyclohydrolase 1 type 2